VTEGRRSALPLAARAADLAALLIIAGAGWIALAGGFVLRVGGVRVSVTSAWRLLGWGLLLLAVRHLWLRRPSLAERLLRSRPLLPDPGDPPVPATWRESLERHALVIAGFSALTCLVMFNQVVSLRSVADLGDPLFSVWRLDWVAHQLPRDPARLFDANIFHPEPRTLAYSDAMLVTALLAAPWLWLGADPVVVHNLLLIGASAFSGVTMFWLVRALTHRSDAAAVGGAVFALYPLRWAFHPNLELVMTPWMPLALLGLHRTLATGRLRAGLATGAALALQALSSFYYGLFLSLYLTVIALIAGLRSPARFRAALRPLAAGALLAAAVVAPATVPYFQNRATVGERRLEEAARFSARPADYLASHPTSRVYGTALPGRDGKLELFPGLVPVALAGGGLWLPMRSATLAYAAGLGVSADASLGVHGRTYPLLYRTALPFRGLRAPDRFAILVGLSLSVLAGYGAARLLGRIRRRGVRLMAAAGLVTIVAVDAAPALRLEPVWDRVPEIYGRLPPERDVVLVDLPFPQRDGSTPGEYGFLYFATAHHKRLVNGGSGFYPPWYDDLAGLMLTFPNDAAMDALRRHGAQYLVVHGAFYEPTVYGELCAALDRRDDAALVGTGWWNGAPNRLYRILTPGKAMREPPEMLRDR
jgi:hypothetical protein